MDFFEHQAVARKNSGRLVILFILAVICIGLVLYALGVGVSAWLFRDPESGRMTFQWINPIAGVFSLALLAGIVGGGTLYKLMQLKAGGQVVARSLGGLPIHPNTTDPGERQLLNIVEEMALASGTPVPPVYMMGGERGINAFAAGYSPDTAVIGVTRGAVEQLSRSEMQGVIAHEFSHILNGDMRINIRLMGILHGILLLGILGSMIVRSLFYGSLIGGGGGRSRSNPSSSGGKGGAMVAIIAVGVVLMILGAIGTFFGTWIKSAISRQREYLADASAVQFTRDPQTIAGALRAIGGWKHRARILSSHAPEASHMFFGQGVTSGFYNIFASHPPLAERIKRVDPQWDGTFPQVGEPAYPSATGGQPRAHSRFQEQIEENKKRQSSLERLQSVLPGGEVADPARLGTAIAAIGMIDEVHVQHAATLLSAIPPEIRDGTNDAFSARAVVFGLLLDRKEPYRSKQLRRLKEQADPAVVRALAKMLPAFDKLERSMRLPTLDISAPALATMTRDQALVFIGNARALAEADEKIDVFEWSLLRTVTRRLGPVLGMDQRVYVKHHALTRLGNELSVVLSVLARAGHANEEHAQTAFEHAARPLRVPSMSYIGEDEATLDRLGDALDELAQTAAREKKQTITACATCISADRTITPNEAELFRVIADELGVPTPPVLPGQRLV